MAYKGLARKWRPQFFSDLVGQEHIAQTLTNAIRKSRISQGYLFTGTRGIGKTSAARIFAKALRCPTSVEPGIPCNKCQDCTEIAEGRSVDVLEIDGASNNGVDAVREIRENVKYLPSSGKYKIYIIDEVHMLTTAAFNALLKTLEEPPAHIVFIFATTDPQKIPETVLSRCQRFDFKRVSQKDLKDRLQKICKEEGLKISEDALAILAREAEGSMRDGVSLLDQVLSISEGKKEISAEMITTALGLIDKQTILDCVSGVLNKDAIKSLEAIGRIYMHGFDLKQFGREVLRTFRTLMVAKLLEQNKTSANAYLDLTDIELDDVQSLLSLRTLEEFEMLFRMMSYGLDEIARSPVPKMVMDVLFIKMSTTGVVIPLTELKSVEQIRSSGNSSSGRGSAGSLTATKSIQQATHVESTKQTASDVVDSKQLLNAAASLSTTQPTVMDMGWWKKLVLHIKTQKPLYGTMLEHFGFEAARLDDEVLTIRLLMTKDSLFYREQLDQPANRDSLIATLKAITNRNIRLEYVESKATATNIISDLKNNETRSLAEMDADEKRMRHEQKRKQVLDSEAFQATQRLLGATLEKLDLKGE